MPRLGFLIFFLICSQLGSAQYTEVINSRRPGFSDSPYAVGSKVYQIEAGLFYKNIGNYLFFNQEQQAANAYSSKVLGTDIVFRTGQFFEKLEFDVDLAFVHENRDYTIPNGFSVKKLGLSKLTIGAKYLVYMPTYLDKSKEIRSWKKKTSFDKKRLIPAVGVYAGLNTNVLSELHKNPEGLSPRVGLFTQNNLTDKFIVLTNFIGDNLMTEQAEYSYIITATYSLNNQISVFGENQGFFRKNVPNDYQFGLGGAYLISKNMQVDTSVRFIKDERGDHTFLAGAGVSWRIDKHEDQFKLIDSQGNVTKDKGEGGFFSRLFGGGNKSDKQRKVKTVKAKKRKVKVNKPSKKDKKLEKEAKKKAKEEKKKLKQKEKDYKKNYEPPPKT